MTSSQPPGWYPDATLPGYERWWDGGAWSPVTRPIGDLAAPATPAAPAAPDAGYPQTGEYAGSTSPSYDQPEQPAPAAPSWGTPSDQTWGAPAAPAPNPPTGSPYDQQPASPYGQPAASPEYAAGTPYGSPIPGGPAAPSPAGYPAYPQYPQGGGGQYAPAPYGYPTPGGDLAGRGARLLARIVDGILTGIVTAILGATFIREMINALTDYLDSLPTDGSTPPDFAGLTSLLAGPSFRLSLVSLVVGGIYHVVLIALKGATLGKMLMGVRVKPIDGTGNPSWVQAALRWATTDVPGLVPRVGGLYGLIDALWCLWDGKRQCLHDKLPKTVVVRSR